MAYNFQLLPPINPTISNEFKLPCLQTRHHRCLHRRLGPIITQIEGGKFELVKGLVGVDFGIGSSAAGVSLLTNGCGHVAMHTVTRSTSLLSPLTAAALIMGCSRMQVGKWQFLVFGARL